MSEEKLYAVKNAKGRYLSFSDDKHYRWREGQIAATTSQRIAHDLCTEHGGHVVTLIEEPEKVVLTEEQAEIVEGARDSAWPANYISGNGANEELLMNAYVNGYTVAKEKKYNVKVPHLPLYYWKKPDGGIGADDLNAADDTDTDDFEFTESEIEHYGLQDCEKEEVTDDEQ
ncbi:DUF1642 domain-containing protein [Lacticaseibacillus paracasei]|uniref:DUF1642 domain-containing protein n=1 Tax=Lacticaseibacillus paracasei TaxID=1597 RepID=UPI0025A011F0|nr:DUF1642 domain-containing protein [Lacticaseibacillus paracasei]MDM7528850.1 DUF1642 domain-containing protein [Lacticaseibacillus paracasei]MDM7540911.1 DUF1642 domain-containing protein [Lacticaseibacillus paracasei]